MNGGSLAAWYVYMLLCADGTVYTGITPDLPRRVRVHSEGRGARYTRSRLPVRPLCAFRVEGRSEATRRECAIKRLRRDEKLTLAWQNPYRSFSIEPAAWPDAVRFVRTRAAFR